MKVLRAILFLWGLCASLSAQSPAFDSPGRSRTPSMGQTTMFSTEFNPAIGVALDLVGDYLDDDDDDGFDGELRLLEVNVSANVDPNAWAYVVFTSEDGESPEVEEAAVEYTGLEGNTTIKAGRFFVDFGKQMQNHLEELRTLERPLPLREYLGEELGGTGVQFDHWFAANDTTPVRLSLGIFAELGGESHGDEEDEVSPDLVVPDRQDVDELSFTGRITGMTDVGENGMFQAGLSARHVPDFSFELDSAGLEVDDLSNTVYGLDATFGHTDDTGIKRLSAGGEVLLFDGDLAGLLDDPATPTAINVVDDDATGFFAFTDYAWSQNDSAGVQYAHADLAEDPGEDGSELDLYYTRHLTEFRRLRLGVTVGDGEDGDFTRVYVQFTNWFGSHAHGLNW